MEYLTHIKLIGFQVLYFITYLYTITHFLIHNLVRGKKSSDKSSPQKRSPGKRFPEKKSPDKKSPENDPGIKDPRKNFIGIVWKIRCHLKKKFKSDKNCYLNINGQRIKRPLSSSPHGFCCVEYPTQHDLISKEVQGAEPPEWLTPVAWKSISSLSN